MMTPDRPSGPCRYCKAPVMVVPAVDGVHVLDLEAPVYAVRNGRAELANGIFVSQFYVAHAVRCPKRASVDTNARKRGGTL